jgi:acetyltransferase-like isoleucine patch superfamily enzyme
MNQIEADCSIGAGTIVGEGVVIETGSSVGM